MFHSRLARAPPSAPCVATPGLWGVHAPKRRRPTAPLMTVYGESTTLAPAKFLKVINADTDKAKELQARRDHYLPLIAEKRTRGNATLSAFKLFPKPMNAET